MSSTPTDRRTSASPMPSFARVSAGMVAWVMIAGCSIRLSTPPRLSANAQHLAEWLQSQPKVAKVHYPGLETHPQHALAKRQMRHGFGGMISIELDGDLAGARRFLESCHLFSLAESLGGVESLIEHPAIMTHASIPPEQRAALGIGDTLIRLSVGIEDVDDLRDELARALSVV